MAKLHKMHGTKTFVAALFLSLSFSAYAVELPVINQNGKQYYVYEIKSGDTKLSVCKTLGIKSSDLVRYNRSAEDGLVAGQKLYFPKDRFEDKFGPSSNAKAQSSSDKIDPKKKNDSVADKIKDGFDKKKKERMTAQPVLPQQNQELPPLNPSGTEVVAPAETVAVEVEEPQQPNEIKSEQSSTIAVVLPFDLSDSEISKRSALATDYYRGLLLAADTLGQVSSPVVIKALDAGKNAEETRRLVSSGKLDGATVIIGSSDPEQFDILADYSRKNDIYIVNSFIVKDSTYLTNPRVVQTYIDQSDMYRKAADYCVSLAEASEGMIPVLLDNKSGDKNKEELVNIIVARLAAKGMTPVTLNYDGTLSQSDIKESLSPEGKYLFIPMSGSLKEFNRFAHSVAGFISSEALPAGGEIVVFGYPEWTAFRGVPQENLSKINARIYSRFFANLSGMDYQGVNSAYKRWYGRDLPGEIPVQALLGYDTGLFLLRSLSSTGPDLEKAAGQQGVQSAFRLKHADNSKGLINEALYTIEYLPGGEVNINVR